MESQAFYNLSNRDIKTMRTNSYLQTSNKSLLDKIGEYLSTRHIRRTISAERKKFDLDTKDLLDYGSGFHAMLSSRYWHHFKQVYLLDFDMSENLNQVSERLVILRGNPQKNLKSISSNSVHFVLAHNVLEHVDNDMETLIDLERILEHEGLLYINVPSWIGKYFLELAAFRLRLAPFEEMEDHKRYYSRRQLWLALRSAGFRPSTIKLKSTKFGLNISAVIRKSN